MNGPEYSGTSENSNPMSGWSDASAEKCGGMVMQKSVDAFNKTSQSNEEHHTSEPGGNL